MITIGICTYNRDLFLNGLLESIIQNNYPTDKYEIVVVDNNSTDNTNGVCHQFAMSHPNLTFRYFLETQQGLSYARNRVLVETKGDILIFLDDDALVSENYIKTYADFFERNCHAVVAGGPIYPLYWGVEEPKWMSKYTRELLTAYLNLGNKEKTFPVYKFPGGGNVAFRMSIFEKAGRYSTELGRTGKVILSGEDKDMIYKIRSLGHKVFYLPEAVLNHIITPDKLSDERFQNLTYRIGVSERKRTLNISRSKYFKRLFSEAIKWAATIVLTVIYTFELQPAKGAKLIAFRRNVTKGLLEKQQ